MTSPRRRLDVRVVCEPDPAVALREWLAALAGTEPVAVLDPAWPAELLTRARALVDRAARDGEFDARDLVLFTSGSSGSPRAVLRSRASWEASSEPFSAWTGVRAGTVAAVPGPLAGTLYSFAAWHARHVGATVVPGPLARLPEHALARRIDTVHCGPALAPETLAYVERGALPAVRTLVVAGDRVELALWERAASAGVRLIEYYGAAELSFVGIHDAPGPLLPFPGVQVQVRDGVLWSRSPYVMRDYLRENASANGAPCALESPDGRCSGSDPTEPNTTCRPPSTGPFRCDDEGWASVGDVAELRDTEGPLGFEVRGRAGAAITTGGTTVVAEEVERFLCTVPGVADVAVTGEPHPRLGQRVVAVVAPEPYLPRSAPPPPGGQETTETLVATLREAVRALPPPSRPRRWLIGNVPRSAAGKILRDRLAAMVATAPTSGSVTPPPDSSDSITGLNDTSPSNGGPR